MGQDPAGSQARQLAHDPLQLMSLIMQQSLSLYCGLDMPLMLQCGSLLTCQADDWAVLVQDLQSQISSFDQDRGKRLKAAQTKLAQAKAGLSAAKGSLKDKQAAASQAAAELEAAAGERSLLTQQLQAAQAALQGAVLVTSCTQRERERERESHRERVWACPFACTAERVWALGFQLGCDATWLLWVTSCGGPEHRCALRAAAACSPDWFE